MIAVKLVSLTAWYCWLCFYCHHLPLGAAEAVLCHYSWMARISRRIRNHNRIGSSCCTSYDHEDKDNNMYCYNLGLGRWPLGVLRRKFNRPPTLHFIRQLRSGGTTLHDTISRGHTVHGDNSDATESKQGKSWNSDNILPVTVNSVKMCTYVDSRAECRSLRRSNTVRELKRELQKVFPGHPPASLQRLFRGTQLLSDDVALGEITREEEGSSREQLQLLLDAPPPVDADTFDQSTVVPSTREALLEVYFSNLMAMQQMQIALSKACAGDPSPFAFPGNSKDMECSVNMKSGYKKLLEHFQVMSKDVVVPDPPDPALDPMVVGPLHELFRDWARVLDVDWSNTIRITMFLLICCHFGVPGTVQYPNTTIMRHYYQRVVKTMIIPSIFLYQTRWAKVFRKIAWNLIPVVPGLSEAVEALLPAPEQTLINLDTDRYMRELYGAAGPDFSSEYIENYTGGRDAENITNEENEHERDNLKCKEKDEKKDYSEDWVDDDGEDSQDRGDEDIAGGDDWEEGYIE